MKKALWLFSFLLLLPIIIAGAQQVTCSTQTVCTSPGVNLGGPVTITVMNNIAAITVSVMPATASVQILTTKQFSATVNNSFDTRVTWQVDEGATYGTVNASGLYTAPNAVPGGTPTGHLRATSVADNTKFAEALVTIVNNQPPPPCSVSISPLSANVMTSQTQQFTATTSNCTPATVFWQVNGINGGNATIGTINASGLFTAPAAVPNPANETVTAVSNADNTKTATAQIVIVPQPPPSQVENLNCLAGDISTVAGLFDGPAQLPSDCYFTNDATFAPRPGATIWNVVDQTTWNTAVAGMVCGDILQMPAGTHIVANLVYPAKNCNGTFYITLRTGDFASLPNETTRITPCFWGVTNINGRPTFPCPNPVIHGATITTPNTTPPLSITTGTAGLHIVGIEFSRQVGTGLVSEMIKTSTSTTFNHIAVDRVWCHGTALDDSNNCMNASNGDHIAMINSYANDFHCVANTGACTQAHAFSGGGEDQRQSVAIKAWNNFLEAAGENLFFGGGPASFTPQSIDLRNNYLFKPKTWNPSDPSYINTQFSVQNCFETKNSDELYFEGNICENVWAGFSQVGEAFLLDPKNQSGGVGINQCPNCKVTNVVLTLNIAHSVAQGFQIACVANGNGAYALAGNNYHIYNNVIDNIQYATCYKCSTGTSTNTIFTDPGIQASLRMMNVTFENNTEVYASTFTPLSNLTSSIGISGPQIATGLNPTNIFFNNNVLVAGKQGTVNNIGSGITSNCAFGQTGGNPMIINCWQPFQYAGNVEIGNVNAVWPNGVITNGGEADDAQPNMVTNNVGWKAVCIIGSCPGNGTPGGLNPPVSTNQSLVATPSLDGQSTQFDITSTAIGTGQSNALWTYLAGSNDNALDFITDVWIFIPDLTNIGQIETDQFLFQHVPVFIEYMYGHQCNRATGNVWQVFDQFNHMWVNAGGPCNYLPNAWNHLIMHDHRVLGDTNSCGTVPCEYYDSIILNGTTLNVNQHFGASILDPTFASVIGFQFQLDIPLPNKSATMNIDKAYFITDTGNGSNCIAETTQQNIFVGYATGLRDDYHIKPTSPCYNIGTNNSVSGAVIDSVNTATAGVDQFN